MTTILKQNSSRRNGSRWIPRSRKRRFQFMAIWIPCSLFFFRPTYKIVHKEFVPPEQTVNSKLYYDVFRRLKESICPKHPEKWKNNWLVVRGNAHTFHVMLTLAMVQCTDHAFLTQLTPNHYWIYIWWILNLLKIKWSQTTLIRHRVTDV